MLRHDKLPCVSTHAHVYQSPATGITGHAGYVVLVYALLSVHVMLWPPFRQALVKRHASLLTCRVTANVVSFCNAVLTHLLQVVTSCSRLCCSCTLT